MKYTFTFVFISVLFFSCKEDITPSYLEIPAISLQTDEATEGANSHGIVDAWVYMDNKSLGVFELPARIPIMDEGSHEFIIYAGVKNNGISATRIKYPMYDRFDTTLTLIKNQTVIINPTVHYKTNIQFEMIEDFEDTGIEFSADIISDTPMVFIDKTDYPSIVQYGQRCGGVFITEQDSIFKAATSTFLDLPKGEDVFLEIDFKSNNSIRMGVIAQNSADFIEHTPYVQMNPQDESSWVWKKIYIDLKEDVSVEQNATSYEIYLLSVIDPDMTLGKIYLDNIKVLRYQ
jgi:hypothetical protein